MKTATIVLADGRKIEMSTENTKCISVKNILMMITIGTAVIGLALIAKAAGL